ncbi:hypothetical protein PHYBLDRAFT_5171, partial [Phycomyces blakesleeanus NRRL 1555(-)]
KDTSLKNWWKKVTLKKQNTRKSVQVFGVPLENSLELSRAIVTYTDNGNKPIVGYIPTIVAKCGFFLKDQGKVGLTAQHTSAKRIGELQLIFNTPLDYGKQFDWKGYSVHDAANVLRRFLNYMPEPVIVHELYHPFRNFITETESTDINRIRAFQHLLDQLPCENQHLLFYLLDLIGVFGKHAHYTKMDIFNLASVFTPGLLLSPEHAMNPIHYKTSQKVVQFLIEHHASF